MKTLFLKVARGVILQTIVWSGASEIHLYYLIGQVLVL
jgi:hypothetical protein